MVRAGFEGDVRGCTTHAMAKPGCLFEGGNLCVIAVLVDVRTFSEDCFSVRKNAANGGIGRRHADGSLSKIKRSFEKTFVLWGERHAGLG